MDDKLKQAKSCALNILNYMDRTEFGLRQKLKEKSFDEHTVDLTIDYVKSFGYINDRSYAERYVLNRQGNKSRREIQVALSQRGVSREDIEYALENCYQEDKELEAIWRLCEKKQFSLRTCSEKEKKKMYDYLMRKGFRCEDVRKALKVIE